MDFPWLMDMFKVVPPLTNVMSPCNSSAYSNDPDNCDVSIDIIESSPAPSVVSTHRPSFHGGGSGGSALALGDVAVIAVNSGT